MKITIVPAVEYPLTEMIGELTEMGADIDNWTEREVREFYADTCEDPRGYLQTEPAGCPRCAAYHELRSTWVGPHFSLAVKTLFTLVRQDDGDLVIATIKPGCALALEGGVTTDGFESTWGVHCDSCRHDFHRDGFSR